jgi:hypothetical protein
MSFYIDFTQETNLNTVNKKVFVVKFVCGLALHLLVTDEEIKGLQMVKHTINHAYKFNNYEIVCFICFTQFLTALFCEVLNYMSIVAESHPMEIVQNFIAFYIIA